MAFDIAAALRQIQANPDASGFHGRPFEQTGSYFHDGFWLTPIRGPDTFVGQGMDQTRVAGPITSYRISEDLGKGSAPKNILGGGASAQYQGTPYVEIDPTGTVIDAKQWNTLKPDKFINEGAKFIAAMMTMGVGAAVGAGASAAAGAGGGGGGGAVGSGAGFVGEGVASGIPAWDAALAASPAFSGAAAGGAGLAGAAGAGGGGTAAAGAGTAGAAGAAGAAGGGGGGIASAITSALGGGGWTSLIGPALGLIGGAITADQADEAVDAQVGAVNNGIAEQRRQFDTVRELLRPYVEAGTGALGAYRNLSGLGGADAQSAEIAALKAGPQFGNLVQQGEEAILQNASATGGLRGGNTQHSLADYRTNVLSGLIDKQLGRYGGLIGVGQNSAAGTGTAALQTGQNVSSLMQQGGAAQAGGIVAGTNAITNALGGVGGFLAGGGWQPSATVPAAAGYGGAGMSGGGGFGSGLVYGNQDLGQYF